MRGAAAAGAASRRRAEDRRREARRPRRGTSPPARARARARPRSRAGSRADDDAARPRGAARGEPSPAADRADGRRDDEDRRASGGSRRERSPEAVGEPEREPRAGPAPPPEGPPPAPPPGPSPSSSPEVRRKRRRAGTRRRRRRPRRWASRREPRSRRRAARALEPAASSLLLPAQGLARRSSAALRGEPDGERHFRRGPPRALRVALRGAARPRRLAGPGRHPRAAREGGMFAFVEMQTEALASTMLRFHGLEVAGRPMRDRPARGLLDPPHGPVPPLDVPMEVLKN